MAEPKGFVKSLGASPGEESESGATADESMLEQHLRAMHRAMGSGNFKQAATCFRAAKAEAEGEEEPASEGSELDEEY